MRLAEGCFVVAECRLCEDHAIKPRLTNYMNGEREWKDGMMCTLHKAGQIPKASVLKSRQDQTKRQIEESENEEEFQRTNNSDDWEQQTGK